MRAETAQNAVAIAPSDTVNIAVTFGIYVGGTGDVKVVMVDGATVTFVAVPGGTVLPVQVTRVFATNTTATNLVALY